VTCCDYTFRDFDDLVFTPSEQVNDTLTGGVILELSDCEEVMTGSGTFRAPIRMSQRDCIDKETVEIQTWGYWRALHATVDHKQIWLDGKSYRKHKKREYFRQYRARQGAKPRNKNIKYDGSMIRRGVAEDVTLDDFLLFPVPKVGQTGLPKNDCWLIGNFAADGSKGQYPRKQHGGHSYQCHFTIDGDEKHRPIIEQLLCAKFGKFSSRRHGSGRGWRIGVNTKPAWQYFSQFIEGKSTAKKFSKNVFDLDQESRLHLIGGYLDGDACLESGGIEVTSYSKDLADQIYALLLSVGICPALKKYPVLDNKYSTDSQW